ncbi:MFS general substrate transporter [Lophiostoma macrostomum CBS 122681]|uniref:MFS general substrate transporter n=1 Tax=Lophiostoma macrostomum CBS 122681 TaxID=1314788 RepID=A0A6A6T8F3_9PLEO|nr:MFS general substrate transporter [Lophiostoma macrostomum CBS 122681]
MDNYNHTRSHSTSDLPTLPASARLVTNLSTPQLQHLTYSIAPNDTPNRFSKFLEAPRNVPVPNRFTFDPQALAAARERYEQERNNAGKIKERSSKQTGGYRISRRASIDLLKKEMKDIHDKVVERIPTVEVPALSMEWDWDWRFYTTGACLCAIDLALAWDLTSLVLALPTISSSLQTTSLQAFWVIPASLIPASLFIPLFSHLSDIFGRKSMLLIALIFFCMGSFIAGISYSVAGLLLGRVIQGIGAGGMRGLSSVVVVDLPSERDKGMWGGILGVIQAIGIITGPVIGAALADHGAWRWIFWLNVPLCGTVLIVLPWVAKLKEASAGSVRTKLMQVDWIGWILLSGGSVALMLGVTWGGSFYPWSSGATILPFLFGNIGVLSFLLWTWYSPIPALIDVRPCATLEGSGTYLSVFVCGGIGLAVAYFLPMVLLIANLSPTLTGTSAYLLALTLSAGVSGLGSSLFVHQMNSSVLRSVTCLAWILVIVGTALLTQITHFSTTGILIGVLIVLGAGGGVLCACSCTSPSISRPDQETAVLPDAVTSFAFFRSLGHMVGVAIGASIFQNSLHNILPGNPVLDGSGSADQWTRHAVALIQVIRDMSPQQRNQLVPAYDAAVQLVWIAAAVVAGVSLFTSLGMYWAGRETGRMGGDERRRQVDVEVV